MTTASRRRRAAGWTLTPNRCSAPDSAASTAQATIRRKTARTTTIDRAQRGMSGATAAAVARPPGGPTITIVGGGAAPRRGPLPDQAAAPARRSDCDGHADREPGRQRSAGPFSGPGKERNTALPALSIVQTVAG